MYYYDYRWVRYIADHSRQANKYNEKRLLFLEEK